MSRFMLDLSRRAWTREPPAATRLGLILIGTWLFTDDRYRPCMVIVRAGEERTDKAWPCVVSMDRAWIWSEEIGDPREAARTAHGFVQALRLTDDPRTVIRLAMLIADHLGDLLTIPPYVDRQHRDATVLGELTITDPTTGKTTEKEILDV